MTTTSACSEHMAGLLESVGYAAAPAGSEHADVVVINTCAVRENAANKLYGNLGYLASVKRKRPDMQIAVAGTTVANAAFVKLGADARISIFNSAGNTHVLIDVIGY